MVHSYACLDISSHSRRFGFCVRDLLGKKGELRQEWPFLMMSSLDTTCHVNLGSLFLLLATVESHPQKQRRTCRVKDKEQLASYGIWACPFHKSKTPAFKTSIVEFSAASRPAVPPRTRQHLCQARACRSYVLNMRSKRPVDRSPKLRKNYHPLKNDTLCRICQGLFRMKLKAAQYL